MQATTSFQDEQKRYGKGALKADAWMATMHYLAKLVPSTGATIVNCTKYQTEVSLSTCPCKSSHGFVLFVTMSQIVMAILLQKGHV